MSVVLNFTQSAKPYTIACMNKKSGARFEKQYDSFYAACTALRKMNKCKDMTVLSYNFDPKE